jgi:hypothetical protein
LCKIDRRKEHARILLYPPRGMVAGTTRCKHVRRCRFIIEKEPSPCPREEKLLGSEEREALPVMEEKVRDPTRLVRMKSTCQLQKSFLSRSDKNLERARVEHTKTVAYFQRWTDKVLSVE